MIVCLLFVVGLEPILHDKNNNWKVKPDKCISKNNSNHKLTVLSSSTFPSIDYDLHLQRSISILATMLRTVSKLKNSVWVLFSFKTVSTVSLWNKVSTYSCLKKHKVSLLYITFLFEKKKKCWILWILWDNRS